MSCGLSSGPNAPNEWKLSLTGAIVGHSSAARIRRSIPQPSTADYLRHMWVITKVAFTRQGASPPVLWSFRYAPEEERYVLKRSSQRLVNPRSGAEPLLVSRGESKIAGVAEILIPYCISRREANI